MEERRINEHYFIMPQTENEEQRKLNITLGSAVSGSDEWTVPINCSLYLLIMFELLIIPSSCSSKADYEV